MIRTCHRTPALLGALVSLGFLAATAVPALALEPEDFAEKLIRSLSPTEATLSYGDASATGDTVILSETSLASPTGEVLAIGTLTFEGVAETADGGYTVRELLIPDIDTIEGETRFTLRDMRVSAIEIPGTVDESDYVDGMIFYQQVSSGPLAVTIADEPAFSLNEIVIDIARRPNDSGIDTMMRAEGLYADLGMVEEAKASEAIEALELEEVTGRMNVTAGWDVASGEIDISDYAIELDDIGRLVMMLRISGYTPEFAQALQETQELGAGGNDEMTGLAMLGLMQQLTFNSASIRFEDSSITRRVLNYIGGQQGVDGEQMADAVTGMLPLFLGRLQNPALQEEISEAVSAYLADPKSLTISANPEKPLPFMTLMSAGSTSPQTLPDVLNLEIRAND